MGADARLVVLDVVGHKHPDLGIMEINRHSGGSSSVWLEGCDSGVCSAT
jgi:hypothetical protein